MLIHVRLQEDGLARALKVAEGNVTGANCDSIYEQMVKGDHRVERMDGHDTFMLLKHDLENLPTNFKLSVVQKELTNAMLQCLLPLAFGEHFDRHQVELMSMYGLTEVRSDLIAIFPRRFGKTTAASALAYTAFRRIPEDIVVFAQEKTHGQELLNNVRELFMSVPEDDRDFQIATPNNKDNFSIIDLKTGIKRCLRARVALGRVKYRSPFIFSLCLKAPLAYKKERYVSPIFALNLFLCC